MTITRTPRRRPGPALAAAALMSGAVSAQAQVDPRARGVEALQPVEAGSIDSSPLAETLRLVPIDLRQPSGFDQVYRVETGHGQAFARMNGALRAVFPRSEYAVGPSGVEAQIPAGTTWVIGDTPAWYADRFGLIATEPAGLAGPPDPNAGRALRVDLSARADAGWATPTATTAWPVEQPAVDGVRLPTTPAPLITMDPPARERVDLSGVLADERRAHRTVIAGAGEARQTHAEAGGTDESVVGAGPDRPPAGGSPWADDAERGRTVALLLLKAAGNAARRDREAVATVETDGE